MIYITGDIHGKIDISKLNSKNFKEGKTLTKGDYLIICGDFGLVWGQGYEKEDLYYQNWLMNKPWTTLFIEGNHENFDLLNEYSIEEWNGGKVHKINDSIYHLMRGEVYNIDGYRIFTFGGGASHDVRHRQEHKSWWKDELPTIDEINHAYDTLNQYQYDIDYMITHDGPSCLGFTYPIDLSLYNDNQRDLHAFLNDLYNKVKFRKWYMGHYHRDEMINNIHILYNNIVKIDE